jgi:hypothetical protein
MSDFTDVAIAPGQTGSLVSFLIGVNDQLVQDSTGVAMDTIVTVTYRNRAMDSVAGKFVEWTTASPDTTGSYYPGPGVFGSTATDYTLIYP